MAPRIKRNVIHNPQFVTDPAPDVVTAEDVGRIWIDQTTKKVIVGTTDANDIPVLTGLITEEEKAEIETSITTVQTEAVDNYFSNIDYAYATILPQTTGDTHYDNGYDFFNDPIYTENTTQEFDDYYSFFYVEVVDNQDPNYLRTITTDSGNKYIRMATGADQYTYNSQSKQVVNYSKIILDFDVKGIVELKFENKDIVDKGFELQDDKRTILIYGDPEGFFLNKRVKVRFIN